MAYTITVTGTHEETDFEMVHDTDNPQEVEDVVALARTYGWKNIESSIHDWDVDDGKRYVVTFKTAKDNEPGVIPTVAFMQGDECVGRSLSEYPLDSMTYEMGMTYKLAKKQEKFTNGNIIEVPVNDSEH